MRPGGFLDHFIAEMLKMWIHYPWVPITQYVVLVILAGLPVYVACLGFQCVWKKNKKLTQICVNVFFAQLTALICPCALPIVGPLLLLRTFRQVTAKA